jgi:hypothetical protein
MSARWNAVALAAGGSMNGAAGQKGDGFNPLWRQNLIVFNEGFTPHQFFSDEEIEAAAAGANPEITLVETDEVYRCAVVGRK